MPQSHNCSGFCQPSLPWPAPATSYSLVCSWATCVQCSMPAHRAAPRLVALVPSSHAQSFIAHAPSFFAPAASVQCCVIHHSVAPPLPPNSHSPLLCAGLASQPQYSPPAASLHPPCTCNKSPHLHLPHIHSTSDRIRSYALVTGATHNAHTGLFSVLAFVLTGLALMTRVNFAKVRSYVCLTVWCQLV